MKRYDWLKAEIDTIRTKKFHVVEALAESELLGVLNDLKLPLDYKDFVREFGRAKLYRQGSWYRVGVVAPPSSEALSTGAEALLLIGHFDDARSYFKSVDLADGKDAPVFEWGAGLRQTAESFEKWLKKRCSDARRKYGARRWQEIVQGPEPFSQEEMRVLEARRKFQWEVAGITSNGDLRFKVTNGSELSLPYLSVGIRSPAGDFEGRVFVPITHVAPGATTVVEVDAYKKNVDPSEVQVFPLPDPEPEDRDRYWEFRGTTSRG